MSATKEHGATILAFYRNYMKHKLMSSSCKGFFLQMSGIFTDSALWAGSVIESPCPSVCQYVCLSVCLCHQVQFFSRPLIGPEVT